jgi:hypothetical protein
VWAGVRIVYKILVGKLQERDRVEDHDLDGRIILNSLSEKVWIKFNWMSVGLTRELL